MLNDDVSRQALTRLNRLAQRNAQGLAWLEASFDRDPENLPEIALEVAVETGDPIGQALARWIERRLQKR